MRKLTIALAAIATSIVASAASINWNSGTIFIASDATGTAGSGTSYRANTSARLVTAYLYSLTEADYTVALSTSAADLYTEYVLGGKEDKGQKTTTAMGVANISQTVAGGSAESPATYYGLVLYVDTATAASYDGVDAFVKAGLNTVTFQDDGTFQFANMATQQANWTAVPEPTSGRLMLCGLAGLALRRKRA